MPKKKDRSSRYYEERLKREHPAIYADLKARRYRSVREASIAAGLIHLPKPLNALKREWMKASKAEQKAFVTWLRDDLGLGTKRKGKAPATRKGTLVGSDGRLLPDVVRRVQEIMDERGLRPGPAKADMGWNRYDYTWNEVMERKRVPKPEMVDAIRVWLDRHPAK